ncbi:sulfite exporter TauE/SafE family protein [Candidimonas sp. SYP-B2681]|uniref:sulfite exporter TauE/SafE family protein n=1 Tax=Candidimonas sp. SYP-B2681 TaxID=2497686 RepID=UPI000F8795D0|nr:sulfite exporter TauE/SafE family protein [Candidimonas sp. SYP-B2681]RTZ40932.1 sulfite exporter TauE/SafE family protein [Candidimonas sp. SYP-B2681]
MDPVFIVSLACIGAMVGFAAGLLGIGGGMILVPFLTMLFPLYGVPDQFIVHAAIATSMTTIIFTSVSSMRAHHAKGAIRWDIVSVMAPGMIIGGLLSGGAVFSYLSGGWLALIFAAFVAYSGAKMLSGKPPKAGRTMPGKAVTAGVGAGIGFASGLLGAGGGFLSVPFMARSNVSMHNAVATSAALGFFIAIANSAGYIYSGFHEVAGHDGMLGYIYWPALIVLSAMSVLTAPFGARCAHRLPVKTLKRVFACLLFVLAAYMLYEAYKAFQP